MVGMILSLSSGGESSVISLLIPEMERSGKVTHAPKGAKYDLTRSRRQGNILPPNHSSPYVRPWSPPKVPGAFSCPPLFLFFLVYLRYRVPVQRIRRARHEPDPRLATSRTPSHRVVVLIQQEGEGAVLVLFGLGLRLNGFIEC